MGTDVEPRTSAETRAEAARLLAQLPGMWVKGDGYSDMDYILYRLAPMLPDLLADADALAGALADVARLRAFLQRLGGEMILASEVSELRTWQQEVFRLAAEHIDAALRDGGTGAGMPATASQPPEFATKGAKSITSAGEPEKAGHTFDFQAKGDDDGRA